MEHSDFSVEQYDGRLNDEEYADTRPMTRDDPKAVIEVPTNQPIPVEYIPNIWSAVQSGSWAILVAALVLWSRYGGKLVEYLDNQKEIQQELLKLHQENQVHRRSTEERLTRLEASIERLLMFLTQNYRRIRPEENRRDSDKKSG